MGAEIFIPKLGQTVEEVTLVKWLVDDAARVAPGQELLEVETDKAIFTVEAPAAGILHRGPYVEGQVVPVLTVVATVGKLEETAGAAAAPPGRDAPTHAISESSPAAPRAEGTSGPPVRVFASPRARRRAASEGIDLSAVPGTGGGGVPIVEKDVTAYLAGSPARRPKVTPVARRMAGEAGLDLGTVKGTGPCGRITRDDVARQLIPPGVPIMPDDVTRHPEPPPAAHAGPAAPTGPASILPEEAASPGSGARAPLPLPEVTSSIPLKGIRAVIAERMAASAHSTARVTLFMEADATEFAGLRERLRERVAQSWGFAPGHNELLAMTVASALRRLPYMNARLGPTAVEQLSQVNLGIAVDTERGLLVPVVRDAGRKSLRMLAAEMREIVERTRQGRSLPDDLTGGTFTITNLGMYDVQAFTPIINLPEAAILGVGAITDTPVARGGQVVIRSMVTLSLAFDHRLVDGAPAARFLRAVKDMIEEPYLLLAGE